MLEDVKSYFANFDGATNICRTIALWITIVLVVAFVATKVYAAVLAKVSKKHTAEDIAHANGIINGAWRQVLTLWKTPPSARCIFKSQASS